MHQMQLHLQFELCAFNSLEDFSRIDEYHLPNYPCHPVRLAGFHKGCFPIIVLSLYRAKQKAPKKFQSSQRILYMACYDYNQNLQGIGSCSKSQN